MKSLLFTFATLFLAAPVFATGIDSTAVQMDLTPVPSATSMVTRMVLSLGVVLILIWGAVRLLQRFSGTHPQIRSTSFIRVLDRTYLAPKKAVYVLQIGSRSLAVGVTDQHITPLTELDIDETQAAYPAPAAGDGTPSFANLLSDVRARFAGGNAP